jgi:hypothetical protein
VTQVHGESRQLGDPGSFRSLYLFLRASANPLFARLFHVSDHLGKLLKLLEQSAAWLRDPMDRLQLLQRSCVFFGADFRSLTQGTCMAGGDAGGRFGMCLLVPLFI